MFKKRIKVFAILFSVFLMVVLGNVMVKHEIGVCHNKQGQISHLIGTINSDAKVSSFWSDICVLRQNAFLSVEKVINQILNKNNFTTRNTYRWQKDGTIVYLDPWDVMGTPDLANRISNKEFISATHKDAVRFLRKDMLGLAGFFPGFSLWYYLIRFFLIIGVSSIPSLLAFLSSIFAVSFPITAPITAIVLLFFTMVQGYADDTTIVKLMTSSTGEENNLTLGMLHLADRTGALIILPQKGIWGAYGPLWKFSKGMAFFPVGVICGKGENGARVEYVSLWSISSINIGKFNHVLMGSYNHSLVKERSPFASFKETLYYTASKLQPGVRIDYLFQKVREWKTKTSIGPTLKFVKKKFAFHIHASLTRPYTIKTEWELAF